MKTIWKYKLDAISYGDQVVEMPEGAEVLSIQFQSGELVLWALVDPAQVLIGRVFREYGTGFEIQNPDSLKHISTVQDRADLVWHIFEVIK